MGRPQSELEAAALRGDRGAWDTLVLRHTPRVVLSLLAIGMPAIRAREIAADAWSRLVEQQVRGRIQTLELPGLAIAQARYLAFEKARGDRHAQAHRQPLDAAVSLADPAATPEERILSAQQLDRAREALASCSEVHQRVFRLVYGGSAVSQPEVARQLGLSVERVRHILTEARKTLRAALEEDSDA